MFHHLFPVGKINHLYLRTYEVDMCREKVHVRSAGLQDHILWIASVYDTLIDSGFNILGVKAYTRSGVRLRIGIYQKRFVLKHSKTGCKVNSSRSFTYSSFLVSDCDDFSHVCFCCLRYTLKEGEIIIFPRIPRSSSG